MLDHTTPTTGENPSTNLKQRLDSFNKANIASVTPQSPITGTTVIGTEGGNLETNEEAEIEALVDTATTESEADAPEAENTEDTDDEDVDATEFGQEFETNFGVKVSEAKSLLAELSGFRDEMLLMREWQVSPTEFDSRMTAVRDFYGSLPEEGREQFNTPEGAKVIWEHLQKQNPPSNTKKRSTTRRAGNVPPSKTSAPKFDFKRSDILAMSAAQLDANWSRINTAYMNNRILEDV